MGDCYKNFANYDSAEFYFIKAMEITENNRNKLETIPILRDIYLRTDSKEKVAVLLNDFLRDIKDPEDYVDKIRIWCNKMSMIF